MMHRETIGAANRMAEPAVATHRRHWTRGAARIAGTLLFFIGTLFGFVRIKPPMPDLGLDNGWMYGLNEAWARGLVFGRDVVYTQGPYSFVMNYQYHPATDTPMLFGGLCLAAGFASAMLCLVRGGRLPRLLAVAGFVMVLPVHDPLFLALPVAFLMLICALTLPTRHPGHVAPGAAALCAVALMVAALALSPLVKGTFIVSSAGTIVLGALLLGLHRRGLAAALVVIGFAGSICALWLLAGQPIFALSGYFLSQIPMIEGYTPAMGTSGSEAEVAAFLLSVTLLLVLFYLGFARTAALPGSILMAGIVLQLFIAFKDGFVRHDYHALIAANTVGLFGLMLATQLSAKRGALAAAVALAGWAYVSYSVPSPTGTLGVRIARSLVDTADGLTTRLFHPGTLRHEYEQSLASIREREPLPPLRGTVDIYSYGQSALLANGLDWKPRPVPQSHAAYTASLDRANLRHLESSAAASTVLLRVEPIDFRLPSLEDGLSWPVLLSRYTAVRFLKGPELVQLERTQATIDTPEAPIIAPVLMERRVQTGAVIGLPPTRDALWAKIDLEPTLSGRIIGALYKLPELRIVLGFADGHSAHYRYIPEMGAAGFVLSPLVENTADFVALVMAGREDYFASNVPVSVGISGQRGTGWLWRDSYNIQVAPLRLPIQPGARDLVFNPIGDGPPAGLTEAPDDPLAECSIDAVNGLPRSKQPIAVSGTLRVRGWAAPPRELHAVPDAIAVTLTGGDGATHVAWASQTSRADVSAYLGMPPTSRDAFILDVDATRLSGAYDIAVHPSWRGRFWTCGEHQLVDLRPVRP